MTLRAHAAFLCAALMGAFGCGGGSGQMTGLDGGSDAHPQGRDADAAPQQMGAAPDAPVESATEAATEAAVEATGPADGTPSYTSSCTPLSSETGTAIDTYHGRLDGYLSYVVPIGGSFSCNGDNGHVHLQVRANGAIYDVAVDTGQFTGDVNLYEADMPIPDGPWSEGWHGSDGLTYTALGVHSSVFTPEAPSALGAKLAAELAGKNHISVFGIGYSQGNGCHDVHYHSGSGEDGAIVIDPLSSPAHILFFRF